jgi:propionyl-CoA synthetase
MFWTEKCVGTQVLLNDNWWQTETEWPICSNNLGISRFPTIPGFTGIAMPCYDIKNIEMKETIGNGCKNKF